MRGKIIAGLGLVLALFVGAACSKPSGEDSKSARERETVAAGQGFDRLTKSQQVPVFDYSDERQTLIDILTLRANGTHGTASAYSLDGTLLWWCPTSGPPIPSTYQLTNPDQIIGRGRDHEGQVIAQGEQTGIYTGDSAATWITCLDDAGTAFGQYEEANVRWTGAEIRGLPESLRARADEITFQFSEPPENVNE